MKGKNTSIMIVMALVIVALLGYAGYRFFGPVTLAEGYLYEDDTRMLYTSVTVNNEKVSVEMTDSIVETEDSIPVLKTESILLEGTLEGEKLTLKNPATGQDIIGTVKGDELQFDGLLMEENKRSTSLVATNKSAYESKLATLTKRTNEEAEVKKKEVAEQRVKEAARVDFAKKVEQTGKLEADLIETAKYLDELQFTDEAQFSNDQIAELQRLLEEIRTYSTQPGLSKMEFEVMQGTLGSMKVLVDGMNTMDGSIQDKNKNMQEMIAIMETDLKDIQTIWAEIKASVPDAEKREKAIHAAVKTATDSIAQAKQRQGSVDKSGQAKVKETAHGLYQQAVNVLNQTKAKYGF
ncbi:hypothetical protein HP398_08905 [Brevibacillus sp. HB1.4B]|uniref:hypothetical protein n=1 Tax=Brevibacillus sp. HB1.4B TaxID=2738845 RepID=UPI00156AEC37|nr:hypothetical protein [Brevibacillus sp. HB1.4B]NRS16550.1 hypothetical protein [Brevibacillus sp. HB1.4B]